MAILQDNRKVQAMTVEDADGLFKRMVAVKAAMRREEAAKEKRIANIELKHHDAVAPLVTEYRTLESELLRYIMAHPERFVKPRKHKVGEQGTYGIETDPASVKIDKDRLEELKAFADERGYFICQTEIKPVKTAIAKLCAAGVDVPGVTCVPAGDNPKCTISKSYLDNLLEA